MSSKVSKISYFSFSFKLNEKKVLLKKHGLQLNFWWKEDRSLIGGGKKGAWQERGGEKKERGGDMTLKKLWVCSCQPHNKIVLVFFS